MKNFNSGLLILFFLFFQSQYVFAQKETVYSIVEQMPEPTGGYEAFYKFIHAELKYPALAIENKTEGRVYLQFIVEKDGTPSEVEIVRPIGDGCDEEAVRLLKSAPKWKAGLQNGVAVKVKMLCPIYFKLP